MPPEEKDIHFEYMKYSWEGGDLYETSCQLLLCILKQSRKHRKKSCWIKCSRVLSLQLASGAMSWPSSSLEAAQCHLFDMNSRIASIPLQTTSIGGNTKGFWSKFSLISLWRRAKLRGRAWIWLILRSSSLSSVRSPIVWGSSVRSVKLLLRLRVSRFFNFPIKGGRPWSSLKWALRCLRDLISVIEAGRDWILLYWR